MDEKKEGKKEPGRLKTPQDIKRDKRIRRNCCCCGGVLLSLIIIAIIITIRLFSASRDVPIIPATTPKPAPKTAPTTTANYPTPKDCQQINTPSASAVNISPDNPGLKQDVDSIYYNVYGYNYSQLNNQVHQCGPKVNGESFGGLTNYNIGWKADWDDSGGLCGLKNETVGVKVDIYLPQWKQSESDNASVANWEHYINSLTNHENQHKQMDLSAAQNLYNQLVNLSPADSCDEVSARANDIYNAIMSDVAAQNTSFDDETNHGANQI